MRNFLDRYFGIGDQGSTIRIEILGGVTTFVTMAYIIVVNPAILSAGPPPGPELNLNDPAACTVATILTAVFGCLLMGFYARRPIAVAPYMGENAFIAFSLGAFTWQDRLSTVFISGAAFLVLTLLGLRTWLADSISPSMKHSFAVGIGLFLFLVGVTQTGLVVNGVSEFAVVGKSADEVHIALTKTPPVRLGSLHEPRVLLSVAGFVLISAPMYWRVKGGILIGILATGLTGSFLDLNPAPNAVFALPWNGDYDLSLVAFQLDLPRVLQVSFFPILLTLFLVSFLDTLGTLVAVGSAAGMLDSKGNLPHMERPMLVDSLSCMFGAVIGTSTSGAYIESTAGVAEGARTGLAAVVVGLLFAVALFFMPLFQPFQSLSYAYGPALMAVGVLMIGTITKIDFDDLTEAVPALVTITMMLFTFNIANGLTAGLALYPVFKILAGRWRQLNFGMIALGLMCLTYFVFGLPH